LFNFAFGYLRKKILQKAGFDLVNCDPLGTISNLVSSNGNNLPKIMFLAAKDDLLIEFRHS
jgi:hypothetical protein